MEKISLCLTTYNRPNDTLEAFQHVLYDDRISEIVIVDDCSAREYYDALIEKIRGLKNPKIKIYRNDKNLGVYENKKVAVSKASNQYVIIFDSDNILPVTYLNAVYSIVWSPDIILCPVFARPTFDYRAFAGIPMNKNTIKEHLNKPMLDCMLNTMNFMCSKATYLEAWKSAKNVNIGDSIWMNYLLLKNGKTLLPLAGAEYYHKQHAGSNYLVHIDKEGQITPLEVKQMIATL